MKTTTEKNQVITPETIVKGITGIDIAALRACIRAMMDSHFLNCASVGDDPEPAWCAFKAIDTHLEEISDYHKAKGELKKGA
jgi:hypothetical protein